MVRTFCLIVVLLIGSLSGHSARALTLTLAPGEPLTGSAVERLVEEALAVHGGGRLRVEIHEPRLPLANRSSATTLIQLQGLDHDPSGGRFEATLNGATDDGRSFALALRGRTVELVLVPVLNRRIGRQQRIDDADLDWREVPANRLPDGALTDPDRLIGAEARRRLTPGRVLTSRDVGEPLLVHRSQPVRLLYRLDGLTISTLGTAQDDGAAGAAVRVINHDSRRQVQGRVTGAGEVTVAPGDPMAD